MSRAPWLVGPARALCAGAALLLLAACGSAKVSGVTSSAPPAQAAPQRVMVVALPVPGTAEEELREAPAELSKAVAKALREEGIAAAPASGAEPAGDAAVLLLEIGVADNGSSFWRMAVGFGAGRSSLQVQARLRMPDAAAVSQEVLSFNTDTQGGRRPGLIMPLGVGLARQSALALVGATGIVISNTRSELRRNMKTTAGEIGKEVAAYLRQTRQPQPAVMPAPVPVSSSGPVTFG